MNEEFALSWEEIVELYEYFIENNPESELQYGIFERLQEALQPRDVVEG